MTESLTDGRQFLEQAAALVDEALDRWLPSEAQAGELASAMRHIVCSGGKRLRPGLALLGAVDVGGRREDALGAAAAVEVLHAYSLVHDDLPCMDDAVLRRGRSCVHVEFGEAMGVLAGDALLTLAFELLAEHTPAGRPVGRMVTTLARAAGWAGMVGGQVADLAAEGAEPDVDRVRAIHLGKTAALIAASLQLGGLAGGGDDADDERLEAVGRRLGLAFQIVDDLLDVEGDSAELGKAAGADLERGKLTWPAVVGVGRARDDARSLLAEARDLAAPGRAAALISDLGARLLDRRS